VGDFSRSTFDRVKHYVGVRLQQGVPLVDADWNEAEDIRRYEVQAFLKWFVGDGVPAGNDGFRIAALGGGAVNTIRLTSVGATGRTSVTVDVANSTAAAALGFTQANRQATRRNAAARLTGETSQPFALAAGQTLVVAAEGAAPETVTFAAASFATISAATAAEVVAAVGAALTRVTASAGVGDDVVITGGDGTPDGAGRCLVDGRDAVQEGRTTYTAQPLFANAALAAEWGVPVVDPLSAPGTGTRTDLLYLDVWDREVAAAEDDTLVNPAIGVESCVRLRREWTVRVRPGTTQLPVPGNGDFRAGHSYLALAQLNRQAGVAAIQASALADQRAQNLFMPPSTLVDDVLGTSAAAYRRGENRPKISLREAINALLSGQLPGGQEVSVAPDTRPDTLTRASVIDSSGALVAIWHSARAGGINQIVASRLGDTGFGAVVPITSGGPARIEPAAVALPNGELIIAYQTGNFEGTSTDVVMKRGTLSTIPAAEVAVSANTTAADQAVRAVLAGDQVVFLVHQGNSVRQWFYRRYRHTDNTFLDSPNPVALSAAGLTARDLHAASAGGVIWIAYSDGTRLQVLRMNPADPVVLDLQANFAATGVLDVFVLALSGTEAMVFYDDGTSLSVASCANNAWTTAKVNDTDANDGVPAAVRDTDGSVLLVSTRPGTGSATDLVLRRRSAAGGPWSPPQRLVANGFGNLRPHPLIVPSLGLEVLWNGNKTGDLDIYAKRIITSI
jgi:uncharacterized protein DUF6519